MAAACGEGDAPLDQLGRWAPVDASFRPATATERQEVLAVVRRYVAALSDSDGARACALLIAEARDAMQIEGFGGCEKIVAAYTTYVEDAGSGGWDRAEVLEEERVDVTADRARVRLRVRHRHLEPGADDFIGIETVNLVRRDGGWQIGRNRDLFGAEFPAAGTGGDADDPVGSPLAISRPAAQRPPRFECLAPSRMGDSADDVMWRRPARSFDDEPEPEPVDAPWIDVREVRVGTAGGRICAVVRLAEPPRPASRLSFTIEQPTGDANGAFRPVTAGVRIDGLGAGHSEPVVEEALDLSTGERAAHETEYGWRGSELHVRFGSVLKLAPIRWHLTMESSQPDEPLVDDPVGGEDEVGADGRLLPFAPSH